MFVDYITADRKQGRREGVKGKNLINKQIKNFKSVKRQKLSF